MFIMLVDSAILDVNQRVHGTMYGSPFQKVIEDILYLKIVDWGLNLDPQFLYDKKRSVWNLNQKQIYSRLSWFPIGGLKKRLQNIKWNWGIWCFLVEYVNNNLSFQKKSKVQKDCNFFCMHLEGLIKQGLSQFENSSGTEREVRYFHGLISDYLEFLQWVKRTWRREVSVLLAKIWTWRWFSWHLIHLFWTKLAEFF